MASARICLQWTSIIFNSISFILGILAAVGGAFELQKCLDSTASCPEKILQLVIAGALIISAMVGCCGAVNGSIKTLCALLIMLAALIAAHSWLLWRYNEPHQIKLIENKVTEIWISEVVRSGAMDKLQQHYQCCGKFSATDYVGGEVSSTCFHPDIVLRTSPYSQGCINAMKSAYLKVYRFEYWTHVGLICFEALGFILTSVLIWKLMAKTRRYHY